MATIPWLRGVTSGHFLADVSATEHTVTVKPLDDTQETLVVQMADDVMINRQLKALLNRANIQPPPAGTVLTAAHVNERLTTAKMTPDERITLKRELVAMKMLIEGRPYSVFGQT